MKVQEVYKDSKGYNKIVINNREYSFLIPEGMTKPPKNWKDLLKEVEIKGVMLIKLADNQGGMDEWV